MPERSRIPRGGGRLPSLRGGLIVDELHGKIRLRAWPKPRGKNRHPTNEFWSRWLKGISYVYRYQPAVIQGQLQKFTKGTVWMPRDIFISASRGRAWLLQDEQGRTYYPMAYRQDVSEALDAIGQQPGDMLWRGADGWERVPKGSAGQVLTYTDDVNPPSWGVGAVNPFFTMMLRTQSQGSRTQSVNNTSFEAFNASIHWMDFDAWSGDEFRIVLWGGSSQSGQTITMQYVVHGDYTSPLSSGGDDIVIPNGNGNRDSGWIPIANRPSGFQKMSWAIKGSNSTVDLDHGEMQLMFR